MTTTTGGSVPAHTPYPSARPPQLTAAITALVGVVVVTVLGVRALGGSTLFPSHDPGPTSAATPATAVGIVGLAAVAADPRAAQVGYTLNEYFGGIDSGSYERSLAVLDPAGTVDPTDPVQVRRFERGVSTSHDDLVVVHSLGDAAEGVSAAVTFRSRQAARYGPNGERCTRWSVHYVLSYDGSTYRILRTKATHRPCA